MYATLTRRSTWLATFQVPPVWAKGLTCAAIGEPWRKTFSWRSVGAVAAACLPKPSAATPPPASATACRRPSLDVAPPEGRTTDHAIPVASSLALIQSGQVLQDAGWRRL